MEATTSRESTQRVKDTKQQLATRYAAIATFIWVLVATLIAHRYWSYPPAQQGGQFGHFLKNVAIMGGALYILVAGAGRYAVDAVLAKR